MFSKGLRLDQAPPLNLPLRFFITAPLFGVAAGLLLVWRGGELLLTPWAPQTVALVHLITLGFITMVITGALYQLIPVLVGSQVPSVRLARYVHLGLTLGLAAMAGGLLLNSYPIKLLALTLLTPALLVMLAQMGIALARAPTANTTVWSMRLAIVSLALAVALGLLLLWRHGAGGFTINRPALLALHLYLALGGWIAPMITGVGQAVIPMFYLSKSFPPWSNRLVLICQLLVLISGALVAFLASSPLWLLLPVLLALLALVLFSLTVFRMLRGRRRRITDATLRFWQAGLIAAPLSIAALALYPLLPESRWLFLFGALFLLGFCTSIINGMLYKIVAFLVWLHRFSNLAGKVEVPLLRDIISPRQTLWQWRAHVLMLALLLPASVTANGALTRIAGIALVISFGGLFLILLKAARYKIDPTAGD